MNKKYLTEEEKRLAKNAYNKQHYQNNKEKILMRCKEYDNNHKDEKRKYRKNHYEINKEEIKKYEKKYYQDNKERISIRHKNYSDSHKDERIKYDKQKYENNKESMLLQQRKYGQTENGKLKSAIKTSIYRSKSKNLINTLTVKEWLEILKNQDNKCNICGKEFNEFLKPTKDHIIPISKQIVGKEGLTKTNTQALCKTCNSSKSNKFSQI